MDNEKVELHDEEIQVDEAQMNPDAGTEDQSVASVDKAGDATKKAPARKGDKQNGEKMTKAPKESIEFSERLDGLMEEEATLSDEFKAKSAVIFETAIKSKLSEEIDRLEEEYSTRLDEEVNAMHDELVEKVDNYLNYVVENWMTENQVAIEQGLRTEIAEDFMQGLKTLFTESYIEVPESKVDLVDGLADQVEELEQKLDERTAAVMEMSAELEGMKREMIIIEASEDLADTQVDKLRKLTEELDFEDTESFSQKVSVVKESYFNKSATKSDETLSEETGEEEVVETSSSMDRYLQAIRSTNRN